MPYLRQKGYQHWLQALHSVVDPQWLVPRQEMAPWTAFVSSTRTVQFATVSAV